MPERHADWLEQARWDLDHARLAAREGHFAPRQHYTLDEAEQAIADASKILEFCQRSTAG